MAVRRTFNDWDPADALDDAASSVLGYLDEVDDRNGWPTSPVATIDGYGTVVCEISLGGAELWIQAGDGWDRVIWTTPSGQSFEWTWEEHVSPRDLDALIANRGTEQVESLGRRVINRRLLVDGRVLAESDRWRSRIARSLRLAVRMTARPAR